CAARADVRARGADVRAGVCAPGDGLGIRGGVRGRAAAAEDDGCARRRRLPARLLDPHRGADGPRGERRAAPGPRRALRPGRRGGAGAVSAVLLLHGFLGRGSDWAPVRALLGAEAEALTPDLPGHGRAVGLPGGAYTMNGASDRLVALLDARGVERAIVAGYSMGGRLALHLALQHPSRVSGLVL